VSFFGRPGPPSTDKASAEQQVATLERHQPDTRRHQAARELPKIYTTNDHNTPVRCETARPITWSRWTSDPSPRIAAICPAAANDQIAAR
jgi:hypothetical protein